MADPESTPSQEKNSAPSLAADQAVLFLAASEIDSNLYFASRFLSSDPIAFVEFRGETILFLNELELGRAQKEARVDRVVSMHPYEQKLRGEKKPAGIVDTLELFFNELGVRELVVPANFPVGYADRLRKRGFELACREEPFYPERTIKGAEEIAHISHAQDRAQEAMQLAIDLIKSSRISGDHLALNGDPLTAERVREEIHLYLLRNGYQAIHTIVAGGVQACEPHMRGTGPLPAHRPIVVDIFPRSIETRYWGDLTRTVVKGNVDPRVEKMYQDVLDAQELALSLLKDRVDGMTVHQSVSDLFNERGQPTEERNGKLEGYIHSTGHGVGLDIHELPKIGRGSSILRAGNVVAVEPGLYYSDAGGIRIEDLVVVTESGHRNLTRIEKQLAV